MTLAAPFLSVAVRFQEIRWCLGDAGGQVLEEGQSTQTLAEFLNSRSSYGTLGIAISAEREKELTNWQRQGPHPAPVRHCPWNDAALAGALSGKPGVWLSMDHWIPLTGNCHSTPGQSLPDHGGQALALAREANHRTVGLVQAEASMDWLSRQALQLATPQGGLNGFSLQRVSRALQPLAAQEITPQRARQTYLKVLELADFPGPEPASLALLAKTARRLSDLMRHLASRVRLSDSRAVWGDGALEGPLWNAMASEFQRYLPDLRWSVPDHPPERGLLGLLLGEVKEQERQALNPQGPPAEAESFAPISANAWRHLSRGAKSRCRARDHPRAHRQHPPAPARSARFCQGRVCQSGRLGEGSSGAAHDRSCRS